ncbi:MAG: M23 family metallopeptidase [Pseudomonadales bacterium]
MRIIGVACLLAVFTANAYADRAEGGEQRKVTICHNVDHRSDVRTTKKKTKENKLRTLNVSARSAKRHLKRHGDYLGTCPTKVDSTGGELVLSGEARLVVPPGALDETVEISVRRRSGEAGSYEAEYELLPEGLTFNFPVSLIIEYDRSQLPTNVIESDLAIADFTERMHLVSSVVDTAAQHVSGELLHFSVYALATLEDSGVHVDDFTRAVTSCRSPIGEFNGNDLGNDLSLLDRSNFQNFNYPRITFNEAGQPNNWYVSTGFNQSRWLNNGLAEPSLSSGSIYSERGSFHPGEDWNRISGEDEGQAVHAIADGIVVLSQTQNTGFGNLLVIAHQLRSGELVASVYAHLQNPPDLVEGAPVNKGDVVGAIGGTPSLSPHLHFEVVSEELLNIRDGRIMVPVNRSSGRGWHWPGTDSAYISNFYLDPTSFLRSEECESSSPGAGLIEFTATLTAVNLRGISGGDPGARNVTATIRGEYDPDALAPSGIPGVDWLSNEIPTRVSFNIPGLVLNTSNVRYHIGFRSGALHYFAVFGTENGDGLQVNTNDVLFNYTRESTIGGQALDFYYSRTNGDFGCTNSGSIRYVTSTYSTTRNVNDAIRCAGNTE